jgi:hypothetical protein
VKRKLYLAALVVALLVLAGLGLVMRVARVRYDGV